ncbi:ABC transporter ATP-binding protein [Pseudomaricurvus sp.]|uniref:ABC transporter ATP-binding protein n=1 Tax=Pseudomaricurvus sp. TaxID=2004510 RepID=UPI003F6CC264
MISIKQLHYQYQGATTASLKHIDLNVAKGSLFGLLGPNGAGKTTLLSILSGLLPCPEGAVSINGQDISKSRSLRKSDIALVPQEYAFYFRLSVIENLKFFAAALGLGKSDARQRIETIAEVTGLSDRLKDRAETLSGGLKRRLNLAIGLLNQPSLLLLDEPTVGIDPHSRHFILEAIKRLNQDGTTVVYTSHYMEEVEHLCTDIAIIDHGQVLIQGPLTQLLDAQSHDTLFIELGKPLTPQQHTALSSASPYDEHNLQLVLPVSSNDDLYQVMTALQRESVEVHRLRYGSDNLEELFLNLTHRALRD